MRTQNNRFKRFSQCSFCLWSGTTHCRPSGQGTTNSNHTDPPMVGVQISAGYIGEKAVWLERCDADWHFRDIWFCNVWDASRCKKCPGLSVNNRYMAQLTWNIWVSNKWMAGMDGTGIRSGSIEDDIEAWNKMCSIIVDNLETIHSQQNCLTLLKSQWISKMKSCMKSHWKRTEMDVMHRNIGIRQAVLSEVTQNFSELSEWTIDSTCWWSVISIIKKHGWLLSWM